MMALAGLRPHEACRSGVRRRGLQVHLRELVGDLLLLLLRSGGGGHRAGRVLGGDGELLQHGIVLGSADDFGFEQELEVLWSAFQYLLLAVVERERELRRTFLMSPSDRLIMAFWKALMVGGVMLLTAVLLAD